MLEIRAILTCDRCNKTIVEMEDVEDADEAQQRLAVCGDWYCVSEDGDDVCSACWAKWDEKQRSEEPESVAADEGVRTPRRDHARKELISSELPREDGDDASVASRGDRRERRDR